MHLVYIIVDIFNPNKFFIYMYVCVYIYIKGFPGGSVGKEFSCNAGDLGLIPGLESSCGKENGSPLQYSGLENSIDCIVHVVANSRTWLSDFHFHFHMCVYTHTHIHITFKTKLNYMIKSKKYSKIKKSLQSGILMLLELKQKLIPY